MTRLLGALAALVLLALPAVASAATPDPGQFSGGDGVGFYVRLSPHGTPTVDLAEYHGHKGFELVYVHGSEFRTCTKVRQNSVIFREYCLDGHFTSGTHASGTVEVFHGVVHNRVDHRAQKPYETHHWSAAHQG